MPDLASSMQVQYEPAKPSKPQTPFCIKDSPPPALLQRSKPLLCNKPLIHTKYTKTPKAPKALNRQENRNPLNPLNLTFHSIHEEGGSGLCCGLVFRVGVRRDSLGNCLGGVLFSDNKERPKQRHAQALLGHNAEEALCPGHQCTCSTLGSKQQGPPEFYRAGRQGFQALHEGSRCAQQRLPTSACLALVEHMCLPS